jgi:CBS domain containing-hemolysin-like protein
MLLALTAVVGLVACGSVLAIAEAAVGRMTRMRAAALRHAGRGNAALLEEIESDPATYLNALALAELLAQNGAAIVVALVSAAYFESGWAVAVTVGMFTMVYFVVVEAMARTYGILRSDQAALWAAPIVWTLGRGLRLPVRFLVGIPKLLLPTGREPALSRDDLRVIAEVGHAEGVFAADEKDMIHSIYTFGQRVAREIMVPRPDIVAIDLDQCSLHDAHTLIVAHGFTRMPAYRDNLDHAVGIVHAKDVLQAVLTEGTAPRLDDILRRVHFVPDTKRCADILHEMQRERFHMALVTDEYGSVVGLIALENVVEELVGDIAEEHEAVTKDVERLGDGRWRVDASVALDDVTAYLGVELPSDQWNTVGGLMFGTLGRIPQVGEAATVAGHRFEAERVVGRRIMSVIVTRQA